MASFLERIGLVEKAEEETFDYEPTEYETEVNECADVNLDGVSKENLQANLISEIYNANELSDMSNSIFKAEEISKSLPATMTTEAKKSSVVGILGSFGLTVEGLIEDASTRVFILGGAATRITEDNTAVINAKKLEIEEAKKLIEQCEQTIAEHEQVIATSMDLIEDEVKRITGLKEFLGGK